MFGSRIDRASRAGLFGDYVLRVASGLQADYFELWAATVFSENGMPRKGRIFAGCTVALVTPFKDGAVDEPALRRLIDWQIDQGTPILSPVGTTGEAPTLTHDEHERVIDIVVDAAAGRCKVMAGTGSNSTAEAIRLTRFAKRAGADGALLVAPYYNGPIKRECTGISRPFARMLICRSCFTTSPHVLAGTSSPRRSIVWLRLVRLWLLKKPPARSTRLASSSFVRI